MHLSARLYNLLRIGATTNSSREEERGPQLVEWRAACFAAGELTERRIAHLVAAFE